MKENAELISTQFDSFLTDEERTQDAWVTLASLLLKDEKADVKQQLAWLIASLSSSEAETSLSTNAEDSTSGICSEDTLSEILNCGMCSNSSCSSLECPDVDDTLASEEEEEMTAASSGYLGGVSECSAASIDSDVSALSMDVYNGSVSTDCGSCSFPSWLSSSLVNSDLATLGSTPMTSFADVSCEVRVGSAMSTFSALPGWMSGLLGRSSGALPDVPCTQHVLLQPAPRRQWQPRRKPTVSRKLRLFFKKLKRTC